ncbi:GNAT family N-acetyltransferase [Streptomyces sp. NPDC001941]|uniref:GNAT family N-acetyltransferase n=1 Tax=Streptomyces sp. NPDC001941 TaxID=3154659 RepID=UPI003330976C
MRIERVDWTHPHAAALRARQRAEIAERYGTPDSEPGVPPSADDIAAFFVAYEPGGTAVGCGGLRHLGKEDVDGAAEEAGEVKRMYVEPAWRGTGAARLVLSALEEWALEQGWTLLRLETGDAQPDAVRFYTRCGYEPVQPFGAYVDAERSLCFARRLGPGQR